MPCTVGVRRIITRTHVHRYIVYLAICYWLIDPGPAGQAQRQSSGGKTSGSKGTASDTSAPQNSSDDAQLALQRMEKIREKNRRAQARHREKVKVRASSPLFRRIQQAMNP